MKLTIQEIAELAEDCINNNLTKDQMKFYVQKINKSPAKIADSDDLRAYFINVIQYLLQIGDLENWLLELTAEKIVFAQKWLKILSSSVSDNFFLQFPDYIEFDLTNDDLRGLMKNAMNEIEKQFTSLEDISVVISDCGDDHTKIYTTYDTFHSAVSKSISYFVQVKKIGKFLKALHRRNSAFPSYFLQKMLFLYVEYPLDKKIQDVRAEIIKCRTYMESQICDGIFQILRKQSPHNKEIKLLSIEVEKKIQDVIKKLNALLSSIVNEYFHDEYELCEWLGEDKITQTLYSKEENQKTTLKDEMHFSNEHVMKLNFFILIDSTVRLIKKWKDETEDLEINWLNILCNNGIKKETAISIISKFSNQLLTILGEK